MAAVDVFGRDASQGGFGGAFNAAGARMTIDELGDMLVSQVQVQYQQQVTRVFNVQDDKTYYVVGRTNGQGSIGTVVGPKPAQDAGVEHLSDPCNQAIVRFDFTGGNCENAPIKRIRTVFDVVLNSVGFTIQAQDMVINEQLGFQFGRMEGGGGPSSIATAGAVGI